MVVAHNEVVHSLRLLQGRIEMVVVDVVDNLVFPGRVHLVPLAHRLVIASQLVDGVLEGQPV